MPKANANNIRIEYETFGDPSSPPILLIIGLGSQLIYWDEVFCRQLAEAGLYVIRFDNRDAGLSTKFDQTGVPDITDVVGKLMNRQKVTPPYTIEDMAADAVGLLDALKIAKAHICGWSMGGMIAQALAIRYPGRMLSLTSIYSTTGNPISRSGSPRSWGFCSPLPLRSVSPSSSSTFMFSGRSRGPGSGLTRSGFAKSWAGHTTAPSALRVLRGNWLPY